MSGWRWLLLGGACLGAMVVASLTAEPGEWRQAVQWATAKSAELASERRRVPVLFGEPIAGDPVAAVAAATRIVQQLPAAVTQRLQPLLADLLRTNTSPVPCGGHVPPDANAWPLSGADAELLPTLAPAVAALCAAVRHSLPPGAVAAPRNGEPGSGEPDRPDVVALVDGVRALLVFARAQTNDGERVEPVLAALALGLVAMTGSTIVEQAVGAVSVEMVTDWLDDQRLAALPAELLPLHVRALAVADAAFVVPTQLPAAIACEIVDFLETAPEVEPLHIGMGSPLGAWDHGFSVRLSGMARAVDLVAEVRRFAAESPAGEAWSVRRQRLTALEQWDRRRNHDLQWPWLQAVGHSEESCRRALVKLRLLRLAATVRQGGEVPSLADPLLGGHLVVEAVGAEIVVRGGGERRTLPADCVPAGTFTPSPATATGTSRR